MTVKSNFKLDDRIKSIDDIQTIVYNNRGFIGCKGFVFDQFVQTKDLTKCHYGTLVDIDINGYNDDHCFKARDENGNDLIGYYRFFIPEKLLKPVKKKYRPYSLEEFSNIFKVGDLVVFRYKDSDEVKCAMFTGYLTDVERIDDKTPGACEVMLGIFHYSLLDLFKDFERFYNGRWWSFGTEVKENEE